jgi:isochorismate synthase
VSRGETLETSRGLDLQTRLSVAAERFHASAKEAFRRSQALGEPILAWTGLDIPPRDPLALFERAGTAAGGRMLFLRPEEHAGLVGIGAAWTWMGQGSGRFARAGGAWRTVAGRAAGGDATGGPLALYGFAFDDSSNAWEAYPNGLLVVPRVAVQADAGSTRLFLAAVVGPEHLPGAAVDATIASLHACLPAVNSASATDSRQSSPLRIVEEFPSEAAWKRSVAETADAVRAGLLRKAVLARGIRVQGGSFDAAAALRTLRREYPACTTFAIGRGDRCFLGASPERLVQVHDGEVLAAALAGSAPRGETDAADRRLGEELLRSEKDRIEHALVVEALRDGLAGIAREVAAGDDPQLLTVHNAHHLYTPIRARLRAPHSVFELIARLHPTPAVGGAPRDAALAWIRRREGWDRGWYAGPVGWVRGAAGEGEAAVAIRSALVEPGSARLFAGCGIVADSDPDQELAESGWKLRPLLSALS